MCITTLPSVSSSLSSLSDSDPDPLPPSSSELPSSNISEIPNSNIHLYSVLKTQKFQNELADNKGKIQNANYHRHNLNGRLIEESHDINFIMKPSSNMLKYSE